MKEFTERDYINFASKNDYVIIENEKIELKKNWNIKTYAPPSDYVLENQTVWSFPDRGDWATHIGNYRGNWSPYVPRNVILKYSKEGDWVLDQMVGSGTTLVECKLLSRNAIGVDINPNSIIVAKDRLNFKYSPLDEAYKEPVIKTYVGDARNLNEISDNSIDLIATHPPYAHIIKYSKNNIVEGDLSILSLDDYLLEMGKVAAESYRVLKPGKYCAILIGDTRQHRHYIPIAFRVMQVFLESGFILKEDIIKVQWKTKTTREKWRGTYDFYLIAHEHLFVFRKPLSDEKFSDIKFSSRWW
ncbi:MAG: DNA methyltransferase [Nitrososphaeria archaeon]